MHIKYPIFVQKDLIIIREYLYTEFYILLNTVDNSNGKVKPSSANFVVIYGTRECSYSPSYMRALLIDFAYFSNRAFVYLKKYHLIILWICILCYTRSDTRHIERVLLICELRAC